MARPTFKQDSLLGPHGLAFGQVIQCLQVGWHFLEVVEENDESQNWVPPASWGLSAVFDGKFLAEVAVGGRLLAGGD